jgi:GntR family transcriptional regulator
VKIPKYYLVKRGIVELIADLEPGEALPVERGLAATFGTSRTTVRQAIAELVADGQVERIQGRGTFVAASQQMQLPHASFSANARSQGWKAGRTVLDAGEIRADAALAEHLRLTEGATVTRLDLLRTVDGEPFAHEIVHLPGVLPGLLEKLGEGDSLYRVLRDEFDVTVDSVEDSVATIPAAPVEADQLGVPTGSPMLVVHRTAFDADDRPVEWTRSVFRGDRFRFVSRRAYTYT